jgi:hypothetical protein
MFGSTWWYNGWNRPSVWHCADQCDLCYEGATLATFRTQAEKVAMADNWAFTLYNDNFWFGYSMEPGGVARAGKAQHTLWRRVLRQQHTLNLLCCLASPLCPAVSSHDPMRRPPAVTPPTAAAVITQTTNASCSKYAPLISGVPDCGDWSSGVRYTTANLQNWQKYYNWHDGMTSGWNLNFKNQNRGWEQWAGSQPDFWSSSEYNAEVTTGLVYNDLDPGTARGYMCRTWGERQAMPDILGTSWPAP